MSAPVTCADIAEAVKDQLNTAPDGTFPAAFTAERVYLPLKHLTDSEDEAALAGLDKLRVLVVPKSDVDGGPVTREKSQDEIAIDVGVVQRLGPSVDPYTAAGNETIDALIALVKSIAVSFAPGQKLGATGAWVAAKSNNPAYDPQQMRLNRVFLSAVTVTYRLLRVH